MNIPNIANVTFYGGNIIHLDFFTQKEMALTMSRPQEFYEGCSDKIRGNVFTWEEFLDHFTTDEGEFKRLQDWTGYNIPGHVLDEFFERFDLSFRESALKTVTQSIQDHRYYVIGTTNAPDVVDHELVHAQYYLNSEYREQADKLISQMDPYTKSVLVEKLTEWGYHTSVMDDEINAYMSTTPQDYVKDKMKIQILQEHMEPFIELASTVLAIKQHRGAQHD